MGSISNYISRLARPVVTEVSADSVDAFRDIDDTVFIAHIGPENHAARESFVEVAKTYREEFSFGLVMSDAELVKEEGSVTCNLRDGGTVTRTSALFTDSAALEGFVVEASRPVVGTLTKYNQQRLLKVGAGTPARPQPPRPKYWLRETQTDRTFSPAGMAHGLPVCKHRRRSLKASAGPTQLCQRLPRLTDLCDGRSTGVSRAT